MSWLIHSSTFQSTLPRGERPSFGNSHRSTFNFNPRSREGSDPVCTLPPCPPGISIHAPARGATGSLRHISLGHRDFNPRSREGSDDFLFATCYSINYFNPRSREGSDDGNEKKIAVDDLFQSTLPRGERRSVRLRREHPYCHFNPRSREGSDNIFNLTFIGTCNFNPRSREGSDEVFLSHWLFINSFQSTLPRGERRESTSGMDQHRKFQSTLPRGERRDSVAGTYTQ